MSTENNILSIKNIEVIYDHVILVLKGVSLDVPKGGIVALLGANGAGKTTTIKSISNILKTERGEVTKGSITFEGEQIEDLSPTELVKRGVVQVMEGRHCFEHLTVEENLLTGAYIRKDGRKAIADDLEKVYTYFPRLKERRKSQAGYTSGGEQQMLAVGRAYISGRKLMLLDEPFSGLDSSLRHQIRDDVDLDFAHLGNLRRVVRLRPSRFGRCSATAGISAGSHPLHRTWVATFCMRPSA